MAKKRVKKPAPKVWLVVGEDPTEPRQWMMLEGEEAKQLILRMWDETYQSPNYLRFQRLGAFAVDLLRQETGTEVK